LHSLNQTQVLPFFTAGLKERAKGHELESFQASVGVVIVYPSKQLNHFGARRSSVLSSMTSTFSGGPGTERSQYYDSVMITLRLKGGPWPGVTQPVPVH